MPPREAPSLQLKPGREKSLLRRHPWIFAGAIARTLGKPGRGETVAVLDARGSFLAWAAYSPQSQITARVWSFEEGEAIDPAFFARRLDRALALRSRLSLPPSSHRLLHAESDGLPGVVVDRYGPVLVCQFLTAGAERWRETIVEVLQERGDWQTVYERSDVDVRRKEGLALRSGLITGEEPPPAVGIEEYGCQYLVDVRHGHKTGFYLDQRDNRRKLATNASGADVLNCFSYTGAFTIAALRGGARSVTNVESSQSALDALDRHVQLNGMEPGQVTNVCGDVFKVLREFRIEGRRFDAVILDPPKFVESKNQLMSGARGYKDINMLAFQLLSPGGSLRTFSCSGLVPTDLFQKIVADAALDARRDAVFVERLEQAKDHPTALWFPEGSYLKGLHCVAA